MEEDTGYISKTLWRGCKCPSQGWTEVSPGLWVAPESEAVHAYCSDCAAGGNDEEIARCEVEDCQFWPYRKEWTKGGDKDEA